MITLRPHPELTAPGTSAWTQCSFTMLAEPCGGFSELDIQRTWCAMAQHQQAWTTTADQRVEVVRPGTVQHNSGPDIEGAMVRIDGQLWAGTVEVHRRSSDWEAHGHHRDPAYGNVVLHVVLQHDREVYTMDGRRLPTVEIPPPEPVPGTHALPCAEGIRGMERVQLAAWLDRVGVERLERRVEAVATLHRSTGQDPTATFHHLLAVAWGGKVNGPAFAQLVRRLPWPLLARYRHDPIRCSALVFGQAGLLDAPLCDPYPAALREEYQHLVRMHGLGPMQAVAWKYARMRPAEFPTLRLAQFSAFLQAADSRYDQLLATADPSALRRLLRVPPDPYWTDHLRFDVAATPAPRTMGVGAADRIIINAIVPMLLFKARTDADPRAEDRAMDLLAAMPAEKNRILRAWEILGVAVPDAGRGQALVELTSHYCEQRACLNCGIGRRLGVQPAARPTTLPGQ